MAMYKILFCNDFLNTKNAENLSVSQSCVDEKQILMKLIYYTRQLNV